ncbi:MAG: CopG family transcriptional regulator [archaeon GB-1867-035]|nr:CopG family transcriptional regulator [Candidatus Culexmicrobium profundum]
MSTVISIRVSKRLKELMDKCENVDWSEEVRQFIARRVREVLMEAYLKAARNARRQLSKLQVPVDKLIREDREREH